MFWGCGLLNGVVGVSMGVEKVDTIGVVVSRDSKTVDVGIVGGFSSPTSRSPFNKWDMG